MILIILVMIGNADPIQDVFPALGDNTNRRVCKTSSMSIPFNRKSLLLLLSENFELINNMVKYTFM